MTGKKRRFLAPFLLPVNNHIHLAASLYMGLLSICLNFALLSVHIHLHLFLNPNTSNLSSLQNPLDNEVITLSILIMKM